MATKCTDYNFHEIEPHWQRFWEENHAFRAEDKSAKPKFYVLDMFPYPSGSGEDVGAGVAFRVPASNAISRTSMRTTASRT